MVYVTGDLHGDLSRFSSAEMRRLKRGDTLIVCGDFGFLWTGSKKEKKILQKLGRLPYAVLFLDGCHENFDLLRELPVTDWCGGRAQVVDGGLVHLLRGQVYTIEGYRFFTFGAESNEYELRRDSGTWWEEEMPSEEEMREGLRNLERAGWAVDYIVTHEAPARPGGYLEARAGQLDGVNIYLSQIEEKVTFKRWFFGSLHIDKQMSRQHAAVFRSVHPVIQGHARK